MSELNNKWKILIATGCMVALANLDMTIVNLGLAAISDSLNSNLSNIQWVINGYFLSAAIFFTIGGKLAQIYGKKIIFLIGVTLFLLSSLMAGLTNNYLILIFARIIQGIGFALTLSLAVVMTTGCFPTHQKGFVAGFIVTIVGISQAIGPFIGGVILSWLSWHWIFLINIPFCVISLMVTYWVYPNDYNNENRLPFDWFSALLMGTGLFLLLYGLNSIYEKNISYIIYLGCIIIGFIILILFFLQQHYAKKTLIKLSILKNRDFFLALNIRALYVYGSTVFLFLIPLYLQNILNLSPMQTGSWILSASLIIGILSPFVGYIIDNIGYKKPIVVSMLLSCICFAMLLFISVDSKPIYFLSILLLYGISTSLNIPSTITVVVKKLNSHDASMGTGLYFTLMFVSASFAVAISGAQMSFINHQLLASTIEQLGLLLNQTQQMVLQDIVLGIQNLQSHLQLFNVDDMYLFEVTIKTIYLKGFKVVMFTTLICTMLGTWMSLFLNRPKANYNTSMCEQYSGQNFNKN